MFNNIIRRFNQYKRERFLKRLGMEPLVFKSYNAYGEYDHPSLLLLKETERFLNEL